MSTPPLPAHDAELRDWLLSEAEQHGAAVIEVDQDDQGAGYAFTVGAWRRFGIPEAVVIGLPDAMGSVLLNAYVSRASAGERFAPGQLYDDFFEGIPVTAEKVAKGWYPEYFGSAFLLYSTGNFPAIQLIVPTPEGQWPWSLKAPAGFAAWQPVLTESGKPQSWRPGVDGP